MILTPRRVRLFTPPPEPPPAPAGTRAVEPLYDLPDGLTYNASTDTITGDGPYPQAWTRPTVDTTVTLTEQGSGTANMAALQAAVNAAAANLNTTTELVLPAGAVYAGELLLPTRSDGTGWVVLRTAAVASLPVSPILRLPSVRSTVRENTHAAFMPILRTTAPAGVAIRTAPGASRYWFRGLLCENGANVICNNVVFCGRDTPGANPRDIVFEQCIARGALTGTALPVTGFRMDVDGYALLGCSTERCFQPGTESKALLTVASTGRVVVYDNYLTSASVVTMFGGGDSAVVPADIWFCRNWHFMPLGFGTAKNCIEWKFGNRILVEHSVFENSYPAAQNGYVDVVKSTNQGGTMPQANTRNLTVRQNAFLNVFAGVTVAGAPEFSPVNDATHRIDYHQNVYVCDTANTGGGNSTPILLNTTANVTGTGTLADRLRAVRFRQNTVLGPFQKAVFFSGTTDADDVGVTRNVMTYGLNNGSFAGINGDGSQNPSGPNQGEPLFADYTTNSTLAENTFFCRDFTLSAPLVATFPNNTILHMTGEAAVVESWNPSNPLAGNLAIRAGAALDERGAPWERFGAILNLVRST